ncbi:MAG: hypothetical protein HY369_03005 [Candidatus Aenigmarchaeota archaeon]|nr:hypothetical protein [Candidatus Aenigmarchaeota archaeon]
MGEKLNRYKNWPQISVADQIQEIRAVKKPAEWKLDPVGYFLIKVNPDRREIEVGFCRNDHKLTTIVRGTHPEEIYYTLLRHGLISSLMHAANVGEELEKAYIALRTGVPYVQDDDLKLDDLQRPRQ